MSHPPKLLFAPIPRELEYGEGKFSLEGGLVLETRGMVDPVLEKALGRFCAELRESRGIMIARDGAGRDPSARVLIATGKSGIHPQGYALRVRAEEIRIEAGSGEGAWNGLQTLRQILLQAEGAIPCLEIADCPDFPQRGVMLDVSRCKVPKMETLFDLVDLLAGFKINHLQLYIEHTFAFKDHAAVWKEASPFTGEEIRRLDRYCRERYIELVPNLNSFGHLERWLRHPAYRHLAECPEGFTLPGGRTARWGRTLKPNAESLAFLEALYAEYLPNFSSSHFNVGCDETRELGLGWSRALVERRSAEEVYFDFLIRISRLVRKEKRKMLFWADIILRKPELVARLPDSVTGLIWGYEAEHPFAKECRIFAETKRAFYVAPGTSSWSSIGGRVDNALKNLANAAAGGARYGARGYLVTDWGDGGHHQFLPVSYPGFVFGAALAWDRGRNAGLPLEAILNRFVFFDESGETGKLFLALGQTDNFFEHRLRNRSVLQAVLFSDPPTLNRYLKDWRREEFEAVLEPLERLEKGARKINPERKDKGVLRRELETAAQLLRLAARRALARRDGNKEDLSRLGTELRNLAVPFRDCWLARNRPGGLAESAARLKKAAAALG